MPKASQATTPGGTGPPEHDRAEAERMAAVRRYDILDTPPDGAFDRIAALAARLLDAPAATVAIVDTDRVWFKAVHGLEGVTQVGRGPGLCASVIASDEVRVVPDTLLDPESSANTLVTGAPGVRFYAAAPIVTGGGHRLGTVNVLDTKPRAVAPEEAAVLADLAAIVRDELELRLAALRTVGNERAERERAERERKSAAAFASALQQALLPPSLPAVPGLELACHYHTVDVHDVGGDFYDVFPLGSDRWAFFLGDVCGKGVDAAALTSLTRYTLRTAALYDGDAHPERVLSALNTSLLLDPAVGSRFCTAVFGTLAPCPAGGFTATLATGGHPPALHLRSANGRTRVEGVRPRGGMLIGALPDARFASRTLHLAPGQALLLYTDGLVEARTGSGDMLGDQGLAEHLAGHTGPLSATALVERTTELLSGLTGGVRDDVAVLTLSAPSGAAGPPASGTSAVAAPPPDRSTTPVGEQER